MAGFRRHVQMGLRTYGGLIVLLGAAGAFSEQLPVPLARMAFPLGRSPGAVLGALGVGLALSWWGALFPDVDIKSHSQRLFYRFLLAVELTLLILYYWRGVVLYLELAAWGGLLGTLPLVGKHRGWTHSRSAMVLLPSPILLLPLLFTGRFVWEAVPFYLAAALGYGSHLYADGLLFRR